jgi:uncharacterized protein DUF3223
MTQFLLGQRIFKTKRQAELEVRRILHTAPIDQLLSDDEDRLIRALHELHPRREIADPLGFCVSINDYRGTPARGFQVVDPFGSQSPFSYRPCLYPASAVPSVIAAMRGALHASMRSFVRASYHGRALLPCYLGGHLISIADAQAHHLPPNKFRDIAEAFIGLLGLPEIVTAPAMPGDDFADLELKQRWIAFHNSLAWLQVVCAKCNLEDERASAAPHSIAAE